MVRLDVKTESAGKESEEESVYNVDTPDFDPYQLMGFGYVAMRKTWLTVTLFFAIAIPVLMIGAYFYYYSGTYGGLYDLKSTAYFTISNLQLTEQVCIQNYVGLNNSTRVIACPSGS